MVHPDSEIFSLKGNEPVQKNTNLCLCACVCVSLSVCLCLCVCIHYVHDLMWVCTVARGGYQYLSQSFLHFETRSLMNLKLTGATLLAGQQAPGSS